MKKYIEIFYTKKPIVALILVISIITSIYGIFQIKLNTDFSLFASNDSVYQERLDDLEQEFPTLNQITLLLEAEDFNLPLKEDLYSIERSLEDIESIIQIQGVAPETFIINGNTINYEDMSIDQLNQYYTNFQEFSPITEIDGVHYFSYTLFINDDFSKEDISELENILDQYDYDTYISGDDYSQHKITDYIIQILLMLPPLAILTIFIVFRIQMKNTKATIFSVLPAGVGSLWTLGIVGLLGNEVSILTAIVPIFIIVIGSADGLHFMSHLQDAKRDGLDTKQGLIHTLKIVGVPMIVTTLTSMAGFLSLLTMDTDSIFDLAVFSSLGIFLAGLATWVVLPFILSNDLNVMPKNPTTVHKTAKPLQALWGLPSTFIVVILVVISSFFVSSINNEFDMLMVYKNYTEVKTSADKISEVNGGSIPMYVTVSLDQSITSMDSKNLVDNISGTLLQEDTVAKVISPYRLFDIIYYMQTQTQIDNDFVLNGLYTNASQDPNNMIHNLMNQEDQIVRLLVFPTDLENETLLSIEESLEDYDNTSITGVQYLLMDLNTSIGTMQLYSILVALGIVVVLMALTLRNLRVAFISILPIIVTIISLYGFLGITQIPLNITTVMIFSITIGVGIDYAVHYSSVYQFYIKEGQSNKDAVKTAFNHSSRPIIANALGISLGLSIMMLSPLTIHFNVSVLMWVSMLVSVLVTLTFLPTIFSLKKEK
jgi:predicted RND superfamily exporter protein